MFSGVWSLLGGFGRFVIDEILDGGFKEGLDVDAY